MTNDHHISMDLNGVENFHYDADSSCMLALSSACVHLAILIEKEYFWEPFFLMLWVFGIYKY